MKIISKTYNLINKIRKMDRNGNPFFKTVNNGYGESW